MTEVLPPTYNVNHLVKMVLETIPPPYTDDIAARVADAINNNPDWHAVYVQLVEHHGKYLVDHSLVYNAHAIAGLPEPPPPPGTTPQAHI